MHDNVCFVDTETTGLDPERHEIWEVGLITPDDVEHVWQLPVDLGLADAKALEVSGYHTRWARPGVHVNMLDQFATQFASLTRGLHLAGAVVSFDAERLHKLLRANFACPEWHYHLIDVEALAVGFLAGRAADACLDEDERAAFQPPWTSTDLSCAVGVDPAGFDRHTALGDARWAKAIYEVVMEAIPTEPVGANINVVEAGLVCPAVYLGAQHCFRDEDHPGWHESDAMAWNDRGATSIRGVASLPCDDRVGEFLCCRRHGHAGRHRSPYKAGTAQLEWRNVPDEEPF